MVSPKQCGGRGVVSNFVSHNLLINAFVFKPLTFILNLQRKPGPQNPDTVQVSEEEIPFLYQMKLNSGPFLPTPQVTL